MEKDHLSLVHGKRRFKSFFWKSAEGETIYAQKKKVKLNSKSKKNETKNNKLNAGRITKRMV